MTWRMTAEQFWARLGLSFVWFAVLAIVNAAIGGLVPIWVCALLGLVFGFFGTMIFVAVWRSDDSHGSSHHGSGGGSIDWFDW